MATDVKLDWTNPATTETGSNVYRNQTGTDPWGAPITTLPADSITYTDPQVADGTWWYRVTNTNASGESVDEGTNIESITLGPAVSTYMEDTFSGTNGDGIGDVDPNTGRIPDTTGTDNWYAVGGFANDNIQDNAFAPTGVNSANTNYYDLPSADFVATMVISVRSGDRVRTHFRNTNTASGNVWATWAVEVWNTTIELREDGVVQASVAPVSVDSGTLEVTANDETISFVWNSASDTDLSSTPYTLAVQNKTVANVGVSGRVSTQRIDSIKVESI